jgi:hypothetical protein
LDEVELDAVARNRGEAEERTATVRHREITERSMLEVDCRRLVFLAVWSRA